MYTDIKITKLDMLNDSIQSMSPTDFYCERENGYMKN